LATGRVPTTANSPLTAKGDLFGYSTTQARVAVGSDGESLVADSSATTGLRWQSTPSASNPVLNSAFDIWQRGTSGSASGYTAGAGYNADRWQNYYAGTMTCSRQATNDTTNLPFIQYCARVQRNSGQTNTGGYYISYTMESTDSIRYAGRTVTLSWYARAGSNYSPTSSLLNYYLQTGTGTDGNNLFGFTGSVNSLNSTVTLTTTWQRFSATATLNTNIAQIGLAFYGNPTGTASTNDYFEITGVQIDIGNVALPYRRYSGTLQGELAACERYFKRWASGNGKVISNIAANSTSGGIAVFSIPKMRTTPSLTVSSQTHFGIGGVADCTAVSLDASSSDSIAAVNFTIGATSLTNRYAYTAQTNNASSTFDLSAEL
jgi:hypothetical protein